MSAPTPTAATLSIREAAALLGVSENHLRNLNRRGEPCAPGVSFLAIGGRTVVPRAPLVRLLGLDAEGAA